MAGWISSRLKVAETFLQQIDQQAAESLGKNEKRQSDELNLDSPRRSSEVVPLKDQLKKKKATEMDDFVGKVGSDHNLNATNGNNGNNWDRKEVGRPVVGKVKPSANLNASLTDTDWTQLLGAPSPPISPAPNRSGGVPGILGQRKDGRRQGNSGLNLSALEARRHQKTLNGGSKSSPKSDILLEKKVTTRSLGTRQSDEDSGFTASKQRTSDVTLESDDNSHSSGRELHGNHANPGRDAQNENEASEGRNGVVTAFMDKVHLHSEDSSVDAALESMDKDRSMKGALMKVNKISDAKMRKKDDQSTLKSAVEEMSVLKVGPTHSPPLKKGSPSVDDRVSESETDTTSTSDSESEGEREERRRRRAQILAEKAAVKAREAIKERENMVARLEGEKQSLEKILEELAKQQVQEASKLQKTMMEMMDAAEVEKQKHNNTRMEALARLLKLETANADLARSLAATQWNLEVEINRVAELRQQIELKESTQEELRRKISNTHQSGNQVVASRGAEFELEILEAEYSFVSEKIGHLQEKARTLETDIETTQKEMENPTEVEVELKRRLGQLTDFLIQKQAQVEALSSEKATLLFRIETISKLLDGNKTMLSATDSPNTSTRSDVESGIWELSNSKLRPLLENKIQSGRQHLASLVQQLDLIFCAGYMFLRRNPTARLWSLVYFVSLHFWVMYIMFSHSVSDDATTGAVFSLENINNTGGV